MSGNHPVGRAVSALPDAANAVAFAWVWMFPLSVGAGWVKSLMIVMLLEFLVVHSSGFIGMTVVDPGKSRATKVGVITGFGLLYLLFAGAFSLAFGEWWPLAVFGWLLLGKFALVLFAPVPGAHERSRQGYLMATSLVAYVGGVFLTSLAPVPQLGIDDAVRSAAAIPGSGLWVEEPQRVLAFGMLYFAIMAWARWAWVPGRMHLGFGRSGMR